MAGLRELKKRLRSIRTTGQLAGAMRTVAAAKYSRVNAARAAYEAYASGFGKLLAQFGYAGLPAGDGAGERRQCAVLLSSNRGLCGGFNTELMNLFYDEYRREAQAPMVIVCGKMAASFCKEKGIAVEREMMFSDLPTLEEARQLADYLRGLYESGAVCRVDCYYQSFVNMLRQTPVAKQILPPVETDEPGTGEGMLFVPDRETVSERLAESGFDAVVYAMSLEHASGAQAATLMAMRSAFDNAEQSAAALETTINRKRQAEVTASVIETAAENVQ